MTKKIDLDINKLPWEAIARIMAPILAPIILAVVWITLARTNKTVDWLSNVFALAEITPTVDLNLPPGVVLGSFYNSAEEVESAVKGSVDFVKDLPETISEKLHEAEYEGSITQQVFEFVFDVVKGGRW